MIAKKGIAFVLVGVGAYFLYTYMKKKSVSSGYTFPNGYADLENWKDADDGTDSSDNKLTRFMVAIARQEGFGVPGAIPTRANNPGDLTKTLGYDSTGETLGSAGVIVFSDIYNGWAALEEQLNDIKSGLSIHKLTDTISQLAHGYTSTQQDEWAANVSSALGLDSSTTLQDALS